MMNREEEPKWYRGVDIVFLSVVGVMVLGLALFCSNLSEELQKLKAPPTPEAHPARRVDVIDPIVLNMPDPPCWRTPVGHGVEFPSLVENHWPPVVCGSAGYYDFWCFHLEPVDDIEECRQADPGMQ